MRAGTESKGFTLIEVVLSLAIFAMALTVLSQSFLNGLESLDSVKANRAQEAEVNFVRQTIYQIPTRDIVESGGSVKMLGGNSIEWDCEVEETNIVDVFQLRLTYRGEATQELEEWEYEEKIYLLRKDWSDPTDRASLLEEKRADLYAKRDQ